MFNIIFCQTTFSTSNAHKAEQLIINNYKNTDQLLFCRKKEQYNNDLSQYSLRQHNDICVSPVSRLLGFLFWCGLWLCLKL